MKINRNLNLSLTVDTDSGVLHVHSTPISKLVFDRYFMTISKAYAAMLSNGGVWMMQAAPRVAAKTLKRVAESEGTWEGPEGVSTGLMGEIRRITNVMVLHEGAWALVPLAEAVQRELMTLDDEDEVVNAVTFFIVCCAMMSRKDAADMMTGTFEINGGAITSLNVTEYLNSLPMPTLEESIGGTASRLFIPE